MLAYYFYNRPFSVSKSPSVHHALGTSLLQYCPSKMLQTPCNYHSTTCRQMRWLYPNIGIILLMLTYKPLFINHFFSNFYWPMSDVTTPVVFEIWWSVPLYESKFFLPISDAPRYHWKCVMSYDTLRPSVCRLVCRSICRLVCHNFLKLHFHRSYLSMFIYWCPLS